MGDYLDLATLLFGAGLGGVLVTLLWLVVLGFSPRRGRHERPPELEPSAEPPERRLRALPPLGEGEYPRPWFEEPEDPGATGPQPRSGP